MFAVTGATGKLGRLVVEQLAKRVPADQIVAVVRSPHKAHELVARGVQVRLATYEDARSLTAALRGVDKVLLISGNEAGKRLLQHRAVIAAAKQAKVSLLAYTSILRAESSPLLLANEHRETEYSIRKSGLPFALLRNGWYIENYTEQLGRAIADGKILGCAQEGRIAAATRADYAEAAAIVLAAGTARGEAYELAGDASFTLAEFAQEVSRLTGKSVRYQDLPPSAYREALISIDVPALEAEFLVDTNRNISLGALDDNTHELSKLLGRPTTPLPAAVKAFVERAERS